MHRRQRIFNIQSPFSKGRKKVYTHNHAEPDLFSAILLLHSLVQNNIQEDVVAAENADDLAAAIQLDEQPLIEVLQENDVSMRLLEREASGGRPK